MNNSSFKDTRLKDMLFLIFLIFSIFGMSLLISIHSQIALNHNGLDLFSRLAVWATTMSEGFMVIAFLTMIYDLYVKIIAQTKMANAAKLLKKLK